MEISLANYIAWGSRDASCPTIGNVVNHKVAKRVGLCGEQILGINHEARVKSVIHLNLAVEQSEFVVLSSEIQKATLTRHIKKVSPRIMSPTTTIL